MKTKYILTLIMAFIIAYLFYLVMRPFFIPIFWAIVMSVLFYPYYEWIKRRLTKSPAMASIIACATIAVFIIAPLAMLGGLVARDIFTLYRWAEGVLHAKDISDASSANQYILPYMERLKGVIDPVKGLLSAYIDISSIDAYSMLAGTLKEAAGFAIGGLKGFIRSFGSFLANIVIAFFSMFYMFKDGARLLSAFQDILPFTDAQKEELVKKNRDVISATMLGGVVVGGLQALLGGAAFYVLGLSSPILWGFAMFLLSFLPGVGTAIVWGPAAVYLFIAGAYGKGVMLVLWGSLVIGLADNVLRPMAVSGRTGLHPLILFFSILGAVSAFGIIGIIAGPLIASVALSGMEIYKRHARDDYLP